MSFEIIATKKFEKAIKFLSKKYPSLKSDLKGLKFDLLANPKLGSLIGKNIYKIRLSITSKGKGKSGGARVITYVLIQPKEIYLLTIYDKSDLSSISDQDLKEMIKSINE